MDEYDIARIERRIGEPVTVDYTWLGMPRSAKGRLAIINYQTMQINTGSDYSDSRQNIFGTQTFPKKSRTIRVVRVMDQENEIIFFG